MGASTSGNYYECNNQSVFHKHLSSREARPSGAKARIFAVLNGTAEAVPYAKPIYETSYGLDRGGELGSRMAGGPVLGFLSWEFFFQPS
jgi:hypothetical protein